MIQYNFNKMFGRLQDSDPKFRNIKFKELGAFVGVHPTILTKMNKQGATTAVKHVEQICQFFFQELRKHEKEMTDKELMASIVSDFLVFIPPKSKKKVLKKA